MQKAPHLIAQKIPARHVHVGSPAGRNLQNQCAGHVTAWCLITGSSMDFPVINPSTEPKIK